MKTRLILPLAALVLAACGGDGEAKGDEAKAAPPADSAVTVADTQWLSRPLSPAEDSALQRETATEYRRREESMSSYEECMVLVRMDSTPLRAQMEAACNRRRGAPK